MTTNAPDGTKMKDGYQALVLFSADATVSMWLKTVKPPGLSAGGAIDTTTMENTRWRTMAPKSLVTATELNLRCAYDPKIHDDMNGMLGVNQLLTLTYSDGSTLAVWGFVDEWTPTDLTEGEMPLGDMKFVPTNTNASDEETAPDYTAAPTTTTSA